MTSPLILPNLTITVGLPFNQSFRLEDPVEDDPILSLTGYSATFGFSTKAFAEPFKTGTATITEADRIIVALTADETALFKDYALPIIGGRPSAVFQIDLNAPVASNSFVLQGPVTIAGTL